MKIMLVVGARPNFMKVAPLIRVIQSDADVDYVLVHTGQHYDRKMSAGFFEDLDMPEPDVNLNVGSGSHASQTAAIMERFEPVVLEEKPDFLIVVGDVNSTMACTIVAVKLGIVTAHVEAGLRSFDRTMPEEINRMLTDSICDMHFITEKSGSINLLKEGVDESRIHLVGNTMIDSLVSCLEKAMKKEPPVGLEKYEGDDALPYGVVTLHRPSNVDSKEKLTEMLTMLEGMSEELPLIFPMHPRTKGRMEEFGLSLNGNIELLGPLGYLDFLRLVARSKMVITDSGGIQEETAYLGIPCLTLRENTERPATIECGTNQLVGTDVKNIRAAFDARIARESVESTPPEKWDGKSAQRIISILKEAY